VEARFRAICAQRVLNFLRLSLTQRRAWASCPFPRLNEFVKRPEAVKAAAASAAAATKLGGSDDDEVGSARLD